MHEDSKAYLNRLISCLGPDEGRAVFREICRDLHPKAVGISFNPNPEQVLRMEALVTGIESGHPLQYLLGKAWFLDFPLLVNPSVLIPRPETEELVSYVLKSGQQQKKTVLDLCTGSGCIAIALCLKGHFERVEGLDVSEEALSIAGRNAEKLQAPVSFFTFDMLRDEFPLKDRWDVWISNPPYVAASEAGRMDERVLKNEPHLALFVPDDDALLFYRQILKRSEKHLNPDGEIWLELNPLFADETRNLFSSSPFFASAELLSDLSGKKRFLKARKKA